MSAQTPSDFYLSPNQQDLLMAALNSNHPNKGTTVSPQRKDSLEYTPSTSNNPGSGQLDFDDESPYLDFDPEGDFDDGLNFDLDGRMIGDLPEDHLHDKRKSIDGDDDAEEGGGKRREGEEKTAKKPGRKPLTSEPTTKRKAQNRAAQRAFRDRKEKHLKDLETKVEDLEKVSESTNHENGLLRAQVERLQVELKEYRKRLSWISSNGLGRSQAQSASPMRNNSLNNHNDFQFEFPKFGDLPTVPTPTTFTQSPQGINTTRSSTLPVQKFGSPAHPTTNTQSGSRSNSQGQLHRHNSASQSPVNNTLSASPQPQLPLQTQLGPADSLSGLFSPSILEASRRATLGGYFPNNNNFNTAQNPRNNGDNGFSASLSGVYSTSSFSNSGSPGSSSESHNAVSSIGTSPAPSLNSPANKLSEIGLNTINEENQVPTFGKDYLSQELQKACGCVDDPIPPILNMSNENALGFGSNFDFGANSVNWLADQNNSTFDPVLFGNYRETQDNVLSQDFGSYFNDAYPLPDLGSPLHNFTEVEAEPIVSPKQDLIKQVDAAKDTDEVVPNNDKPMTCNKIWDRLQSMEKFRNGEIDIDNLCSELRAKAKCSEGGAVVDKQDVDQILGIAK